MMLIEAMAAGRPIVATRVGAIPEIVRDGRTGVLVEPRDAQALARAITGMLDDPQRRIAMGEAGRLESIRYGWSSATAQTAAVYERAMQRSASFAM